MAGLHLPGFPTTLYSTLGQTVGSLRQSRRPRIQSKGGSGNEPEDQPEELPSFIKILNHLLRHGEYGGQPSDGFITSVDCLHDVMFSGRCPVLGTGHHFMVYACSFELSNKAYVPFDKSRACNTEVHCLKAPNFTSSVASSSKSEFRKEYYDTALQEIRVQFHPSLRRHDNIINLFGFDFQEDYDDCEIAWPVLLVEYAEHGTFDTFQQDVSFDAELIHALLLDVANGIQALHDCNIIHGDVKSENILICRHQQRKYVARISDFGLSVINPDVNRADHRLPGGTFLWKAPESDKRLSVDGLRQTDVYSYGLMAWRVLSNNPNPYSLIPPSALGLQGAPDVREIVTASKALRWLPKLLSQTLNQNGMASASSRQLFESTVGLDPSSRNLNKAISAIDPRFGRQVTDDSTGNSQEDGYWATEVPSVIMEQILDGFPENVMILVLKRAVFYSLITDLQDIFSSNSKLSPIVGWMLFHFHSSVQCQEGNKSISEGCRILHQLCQQESVKAQAIFARFLELDGRKTSQVDLAWLLNAATDGSYHAMKFLRDSHPEHFLRLMQNPLDFEPATFDLGDDDAILLKCCRLGDYSGCKIMLNAGVCPKKNGIVSPLHWLVSFDKEEHINDLVAHLIQNEADLNALVDLEDDLEFGIVGGTPLHWAVWHRNIPLVRALTMFDDRPEVSNVNRAILIAGIMHFGDILAILKDWVFGLRNSEPSNYDWHAAQDLAIENSPWLLPRRLRHGDSKLEEALEETMDILLAVDTPSGDDVTRMLFSSIRENNAVLLRILYRRLSISTRKDLFKDPCFKGRWVGIEEWSIISLSSGYLEIFEIFIEMGVINAKTRFGKAQFTPLQVCCAVRMRNPTFVRRLIEIGCPVDGLGDSEEAQMTPFTVAVSGGLYEVALILLHFGADKDCLTGWLGGFTPTLRILQFWPDVPISRLKFLLEELPRLGWGHVDFCGWPGAGANLLYSLALCHWSSYVGGYRLGETAKYVLSQLADKSVLNVIDKFGATALRMACSCGNLEISRILLEAGADVNLAVGYTPLKYARDWLSKCQKRETAAVKATSGSEQRQARNLRMRAEELIELMIRYGAVDKSYFESVNNTVDFVANRQWNMPSFETFLEAISPAIDPKVAVLAASTPLQPTKANEFKVHRGKRTTAQKFLSGFGRKMDQIIGIEKRKAVPRYHPHNCHPWRSDYCYPAHPPHLNHSSRTSVSLVGQQNFVHRPAIITNSPKYVHGNPEQESHSGVRSPTAFGANPPPHARHVGDHPPTPRSARKVEKRMQHLLLHYVCEGPGIEASGNERKDHALSVLREQLQTPIPLTLRCSDIEQCEEFNKIQKTIARCLEVMNVGGVTLVPVISESGREVVVHVFS